ncbi:unnamed protein product [Phytophthora fragariaefolia]|uniref:Unnamed protein product n=1 Tax=Phytophthora fragariaefolia TaxID=1490495 RepID=A0A9W7D8U6_9STRA|nr:unnamed protein product [Phytophthora fragariaefolia]
MQTGNVINTKYISSVEPSPGHYYNDEMPIAKRMASEWNDILGESHAQISPDKIQEALRQFHQVPSANKLRPEDQQDLIKPITASEIISAIYQSPRDKSGGSTGLSHDFCKDFKEELVGSLQAVYQARQKKAIDDPTIDWIDSPAILCLDLRKAYDTLCRNFMATALEEYGFPQEFLNMFHNLHNGTVASYLVNGEESTKWPVNSGIRQGCQLAPLLFVLAVDFLGRAIEDHPVLKGLEIPGSGGIRHEFNGFVDDSTVFLSATKELDPLTRFGELSGLRVQPHKSILIPLNKAWSQAEGHGYPVLKPTDTTRILGYHFGTIQTEEINWEIRLQNIRRRIQVASRVTNSVKQRIILFNCRHTSYNVYGTTFSRPKGTAEKIRTAPKAILSGTEQLEKIRQNTN